MHNQHFEPAAPRAMRFHRAPFSLRTERERAWSTSEF